MEILFAKDKMVDSSHGRKNFWNENNTGNANVRSTRNTVAAPAIS